MSRAACTSKRSPTPTPALTDERLDRAVRLAMRIASLGRNARNRSGVKVRQPLARVLVSPRDGDEELLPLIEPQVLDELNVKAMELAADDDFTTPVLRLNLPLAGPRLGENRGKAMRAIANAGGTGYAVVDGRFKVGEFVFEPGEVLFVLEGKPGFVAASDGPLLVGIDTTLTLELEAEGTAREFVHRVQNMRKSAGFEIEERIVTYVFPSPSHPAVIPYKGRGLG